MTKKYDLIVVGAGSAGLTAAEFGRQLGASVALIEKGRIGGDCTWTGCVPSKALIKAAKVSHIARGADQFGIRVSEPVTDMSQVNAYIRETIQNIYQHETPEILRQHDIDVYQAAAHFIDNHHLQVGDETLFGHHIILATGAGPFIPPIAGLAQSRFHTYETIFDNDILPPHLIVLGGGAIGSELAQSYARLGSRVTLIDIRPLFADLEPEVGPLMEAVFAAEGINFIQSKAVSVFEDGETIKIDLADGRKINGDMLLVAVGRRPHLASLNLEKTEVVSDDLGIEVNDKLQTTVPHIWAAGDCLGGPYQSTHYAGWQAFQAVRNALLPGSDRGHARVVPMTIFTDPEVAFVGQATAAAQAKYGERVRMTTRPLSRVDRAVTDGDKHGFIHIVHLDDGTILGATIVAARAGEMITEFAIAMRRDIKLRELASVIHPYPTYSMGIQRALAPVATADFLESRMGKLALRISRLSR